MAYKRPTPVDEPIAFTADEIIVSKTDLKGRIIYANDVFCRVAEMPTAQILGQPHNIIRHPDMPRAIFKFLWDTLQNGHELFAYVKNMSATGKYYWVFAHVSPTFDPSGNIIGYHSNRRAPTAAGIEQIQPLYRALLAEEAKHSNPKAGLEASYKMFLDDIEKQGLSYDEFIWKMVA